MKHLLVIFTLVTALMLLGTSHLMAGPPTPPPPPMAIPVDGGAIALLIVGAAFASKKIYDSRKQRANEEI